MAEGLSNALGDGLLEARSAGFRGGRLDAAAVAVMTEAGIDIAGAAAKLLGPGLLEWADLVVALDEEAGRCCPPLPPAVQKRVFDFDIPADNNRLDTYRQLRNELRARIEGMIGGLRMLEKDSREDE